MLRSTLLATLLHVALLVVVSTPGNAQADSRYRSEPGPCATGSACLQHDWFDVSLRFYDPNERLWKSAGFAEVDVGHEATLIYFFSPTNVEMLVKVLDGNAVNGRFWVFAAAATDLGFRLKVRDTHTGWTNEYHNPVGARPLAVTDTQAFVHDDRKPGSEPPDDGGGTSFHFDFSRGPQGFTAGFADYPPAHEEIYELTSDHRELPAPLEPYAALFISGVNRSDDLFMFFKGPVDGLLPGVLYHVTVGLEIATSTPAGCVGVGGAPGESVWIKAGASPVEPLAVRDGDYLRMNVDIGNQSRSGKNAVVLGNVANSRTCEQQRRWERKSYRSLTMPEPISVSPDGRGWLLFGADSGFEARTEIYFTQAWVTFAPL